MDQWSVRQWWWSTQTLGVYLDFWCSTLGQMEVVKAEGKWTVSIQNFESCSLSQSCSLSSLHPIQILPLGTCLASPTKGSYVCPSHLALEHRLPWDAGIVWELLFHSRTVKRNILSSPFNIHMPSYFGKREIILNMMHPICTCQISNLHDMLI